MLFTKHYPDFKIPMALLHMFILVKHLDNKIFVDPTDVNKEVTIFKAKSLGVLWYP